LHEPPCGVVVVVEEVDDIFGRFVVFHVGDDFLDFVVGEVTEDYYAWCPTFTATHAEWGEVSLRGNRMTATTRLGFEAFWFRHGKHMSMFDTGEI
jgi:hypothetical protein